MEKRRKARKDIWMEHTFKEYEEKGKDWKNLVINGSKEVLKRIKRENKETEE